MVLRLFFLTIGFIAVRFTYIYMKFFIKTVPDTSLHETSDLTYVIEVLIVEATLMFKIMKNYH